MLLHLIPKFEPYFLLGEGKKEFELRKKLNADLGDLVVEFNKIPENEAILRIYYLQKINYILNKIPLNDELFSWISHSENDGWEALLLLYGINPKASFFLKGIQFAKAVAAEQNENTVLDCDQNEYELMQERDALLKDPNGYSSKEQYITLSLQLNQLANTKTEIQNLIKKQLEILDLAQSKLDAIQGKTTTKNYSYATKKLSETHVNNYNFDFRILNWPDPFIFRVEDRSDLGLEQELHSFEVSKYFIEDFAVLMMEFTEKNKSSVNYKPVILSQFANQGNLADIAMSLKEHSQKEITTQAQDYFKQLLDFISKLMEANTYHPDIKLTNLLVHNNKIRISDRKTFITKKNPLVSDVRSTPNYAPDEYLDCLNLMAGIYNLKANRRTVDMTVFMAYQLGMALKEFLILTQMDTSPDDFRNQERNTASYFTSPTQEIINLSLLIHELTRSNEKHRLAIKNFQHLLDFIHLDPDEFYEKLELLLPSSTLGIQEEINDINKLLESDISDTDLIKAANVMFKKISESDPKETRLIRMAEKLAIHCYQKHSKHFFAQCSQTIETTLEPTLLTKDWAVATWYSKLIHFLSFGYFRVKRVTPLSSVLDIKSEEFQLHFSQLEFLPSTELKSLGVKEAINFEQFVLNQLAEEKKNKIDPVIESESDSDEELDSGSVIRNPCEKVSPSNSKKGYLSQHPEESNLLIKENNIEDNGELIKIDTEHVEEKNKAQKLVPKLGIFAHKGIEKKRASVNSALSRGDGSNRFKPSETDPKRFSVVWKKQ